MTKTTGKEILVKVNTGTEASPVWTLIGGQLSAELPRSKGTIDVTDKDSGGWKEFIDENKEWEISFESFFIEDDAGFLEVEASYNGSELKQFQFVTKGGNYMGKAIVTELSTSGDLGDAGKCSFTLKGSGSLAKN